MRNNLGRVFLIFLIFFHAELSASTYKWSVYTNKTVAMTNEPIYLQYRCEYSDRAELYSIEFNPIVENEKYTIELLSEKGRIKNYKKIKTFEFIAFVKEPGRTEFALDAIMKLTNEDSIQNTVLGRDNADYEEFTKTQVKQEVISIDVEQSNSDLLGIFKLKINKDVPKLKSFEAYHLELVIEGLGNFKELQTIQFDIAGVKIFSQKPLKNIKLTKDGYKGSWSQKFAFVSENDFKIPELKIKYFDLKQKSLQELIVKEIEVKVMPAYKKEELLEESEKELEFSYDFVYYILTFITGYLFANIKFKKIKKLDASESLFKEKIQEVKSLKELMILLALKDSKKYEKLILKIEMKEIESLSDAKKDALVYV